MIDNCSEGWGYHPGPEVLSLDIRFSFISSSIMMSCPPSTAHLILVTYSSAHVRFGISHLRYTAKSYLFVQNVWLCVCMHVLSTQGYARPCHLYLNWDSLASFQNAWPSAGVHSTLRGSWTVWQWLSQPIVFVQEHSLKSVMVASVYSSFKI